MAGRVLDGWGYVYDELTGRLVSECTIVADPLPQELRLFERPEYHDYDTERWDEALRRIVPYTNTDRIAEHEAERARLAVEIVRLSGA